MSRLSMPYRASFALLLGLSTIASCSSSDAPSQGTAGDGPSGGTGASGSPPAIGGRAGTGSAGKKGTSGGASGTQAGSGNQAGAAVDAGAGNHEAAGADSTAGRSAAGGSGMGGSGGSDPCAACPSGLCLGDGQCVECLASNDRCPSGQYCSDANVCVAGCKGPASCASGACGANHDCQSCIGDEECAAGRVCGAGQCASACSAADEGTNQGCGSGLTCCGLHCLDTVSEVRHCGSCGNACAGSEFCGPSGCLGVRISSLCEVRKLSVILDGQDGDDPVGRAMAAALVSACATNALVRDVPQADGSALNPSSGRPVSGGDELLVIAGGNYFQHAAGYLLEQRVAPLSNVQNGELYEIRHTSSGALIASEEPGNPHHDVIVVQFMREPSSASLALNAYGSSVEGTAAAAFYFEKVLVPDLAHADKSWYVVEWTDENDDRLPAVSEFTLLEAG